MTMIGNAIIDIFGNVLSVDSTLLVGLLPSARW
jgi:hypothetical protein